MGEWKEYKLGEICDVRDGTHDSPKQNKFGKPLVTSKNIKFGQIDLLNTYLISDNDFNSINKRSKVDKWDVLFSMIGTVGESAIVNVEPNFAIKNVGLFKTNGNERLAKWVYYYLKSNQALAEIDANLKGSTQQYISLGDLRNFPVEMPSNQIADSIVDVLSSIDDKIDLLNRQNHTLESMAETLFRKYFIEDAKPEWKEVNITDLFEIKDGTHNSPKQTLTGKKLITSKYINNGGIDLCNSYFISETDFDEINKRSLVEKGDILVSMIGTIGLIYLEEDDTVEYAIKNIGLFKTSQNSLWKYFIYLWLKSKYGKDWMEENKAGSTQEYISLGSFRSITIFNPGENILIDFNEVVAEYSEKIKSNKDQIKTLTKLRDTLLPKLMSNEIKI